MHCLRDKLSRELFGQGHIILEAYHLRDALSKGGSSKTFVWEYSSWGLDGIVIIIKLRDKKAEKMSCIQQRA
jgi:hypothetical protein